jgi:FkbM family methyltransferase
MVPCYQAAMVRSSALDTWRRRARKLAQHPAPLRLVASRLLWRSRISPLLTIQLSDGIRMRFHGSSISAALWADPRGRSEDADFLRLVLRPGDMYVDCGANVGHLVLVASKCVQPGGSLVAIEANQRLYGYLESNLRLNSIERVRALNVAVGDAPGLARISDADDDDQNRIGATGLEVRVDTLDALLGDITPTLLKIDVEGYELPALRGANSVLSRTAVVYCELVRSNCERFGYGPEDVERLLLAGGFALLHRRGAAFREMPNGVFASLAADEVPATGYNLVAVQRKFLPEFARRLAERGIDVAASALSRGA